MLQFGPPLTVAQVSIIVLSSIKALMFTKHGIRRTVCQRARHSGYGSAYKRDSQLCERFFMKLAAQFVTKRQNGVVIDGDIIQGEITQNAFYPAMMLPFWSIMAMRSWPRLKHQLLWIAASEPDAHCARGVAKA